MRRSLNVFLGLILFSILIALYQVSTLIALLFEDGAADAIPHAELPAPNSTLVDNPKSPPIIPKILHQTYINTSIPLIWQGAQESCLELHKDWEYKLWTDELCLDFIKTEYPWFLDTFVGYSNPIQRADAIRYFVLLHFGGIYVDLDDGCQRRLDPLLSYPAWTRRTIPTGVSNDAMGSVPNHPFFLHVTSSLQSYDRSWFLPYITIMASTGPLFLSVMWKQYMNSGKNVGMGRLSVLMPEDYSKHGWSFFVWNKGSSWHGWDARLIFWMGSHWMLITLCGFAIAAVLGLGMWWGYRKLFVMRAMRGRRRKRKDNYELVGSHES